MLCNHITISIVIIEPRPPDIAVLQNKLTVLRYENIWTPLILLIRAVPKIEKKGGGVGKAPILDYCLLLNKCCLICPPLKTYDR